MRTPADTSAPPPTAASAPAAEPATSTAHQLARATDGTIAYEDDGRMSVLFPAPGAVAAPAGPVLAREVDAPTPAPAVTAAPAPPAAGAAPALDVEDLYQDFMRRLRRDVLEQREQIGELY
jgi:hypothetical protein